MPVNDPKLIQEVIDQIHKIPKDELIKAVDKVYKEMQEEVDKNENF